MQEILNDVTDIDMVVNLKLPEQVLIDKCLGRRICSECGKNFNVATIDVKGENGNPDIYMDPLLPPSQCASKLVTRSDDTETVVKQRLAVYTEKVLVSPFEFASSCVGQKPRISDKVREPQFNPKPRSKVNG